MWQALGQALGAHTHTHRRERERELQSLLRWGSRLVGEIDINKITGLLIVANKCITNHDYTLINLPQEKEWSSMRAYDKDSWLRKVLENFSRFTHDVKHEE